ncbi:MAG: YebC/PmpR family DNA-binding transcriptional regulator [Parcubacteria group bacterium]|nr:YebC/PmpR family DNA-binding transcriptional regulator [Parcubacteria group bacterium]
MSGHNKWSQIKHQKAKTDGQKSKIFSKFAKLITQEAKKAGGNTDSPSLKTAIERARAANMPSENIDRAVKKASTENTNMEHITYEAYGPGGCALIIDVLTDNRNKAAQEVKHILSLHNFPLAGIGSATWAFVFGTSGEQAKWTPKTMISISEDDGVALHALIEELEGNDEVQDVYTNAE